MEEAMKIMATVDKVSRALVELTATAEATLACLERDRADDPNWMTSAMRTALIRDIKKANDAFQV